MVRSQRWLLLICVVVFSLYGLLTTGSHRVSCDRSPSGQVLCHDRHTLLFGQIPYQDRQFSPEDVQVNAVISDATPRGGVRFTHRIILVGAGEPVMADPIVSPLSAAEVSTRLRRYLQGDGPTHLDLGTDRTGTALVRSLLLAGLLAVVVWGLGGTLPSRPPLLPDD